VLLHQPHGGMQGQSVDMEIQVRETVEMRERMVEILVGATGQTRERVVADLDRDFILRGQAAVDYGVVDAIVTKRPAFEIGPLHELRDGDASGTLSPRARRR